MGNRIKREIGGHLVTSTYDPLGLIQELIIGKHQPLNFTRDAMGRETLRQSPSGFRLEQRYDAIGQLLGQKAGLSIESFGKGLEGLRAAHHLGLNPKEATSQVERTYQWNKSFEPTEIKDNRWGKTDYSYDANGQIGKTHFADGSSERFTYDRAKNLTGFGEADGAISHWKNAKGGAITKATGPHGERIEFIYDKRNRVVERKLQRNGFRLKTWKYTWDAKDRLIATTTPEGERWTYGYDPFGRRITKINVNAAKAAIQQQAKGQLTEEDKNRGAFYEETKTYDYPTKNGKIIVGTSYLWDGNTIAEEADLLGDGTTDWDNATRWHYEPDTFLPIAKEDKDGNLFYIVNDHLGTPREMFSEDGLLTWAAQYRTWGGIKHIFKPDNDNEQFTYTTPTGGGSRKGNLALKHQTVEAIATQDCPIRFQGQWEDAETGLYYNRYRYYDPLAGQYLSPDPIGLEGGTRPQGYVHNPNAWVDPWGLASEDPSSYLRQAMKIQGLDPDGPIPSNMKQGWIDNNQIKYEVRIHPANPKYDKTGDIYRVSRQTSGKGTEYLGSDGKWYHESTLKETYRDGRKNPNYNENAAKNTHIQKPNGSIPKSSGASK